MTRILHNFKAEIRHYLKTTDKLLLSAAIICSALSTMLIYSLYPEAISTLKPVFMQAGASIIGLAAAVFLSLFDYHDLAKLWKIYVPVTLILSLLLFTPLGQMRGGTGMGSDDINWLNLGFITIQPSEFLKIAFILSFSLHCYTVRKEINQLRSLLFLSLHAAVPIGLIALQGDFGTMLVFVAIFVCILFSAGIKKEIVFGGLLLAGGGLFLFWNFIMPSYLKARFTAVYNLDATKLNLGLQQYQGRITLGSGQLFGKGFFSNNLLTSTPELYDDMMFAHVGQVLGFVGCLAVALLLIFICWRTLVIGMHAKDFLGRFICVGVFAVICSQVIINIGMVLCVLPVIGITLPLLSAGGSSVISIYLCIGLAVCVKCNSAKATLF